MSCRNLIDGRCTHAEASAAFGPTPSAGVCGVCPHYDGPARGLGDVVEKVARATGVAQVVKVVVKGDCGCTKRRAALNQAFPSNPS